MAVERAFGLFDIGEVLAGRWITSEHVREIFQAIPYLYEVIGNEAPPSSGAQEKMGHDHSGYWTNFYPGVSSWELPGGRPITRGGIGSNFGGQVPLYSQAVSKDWTEVDYSCNQQRNAVDPTSPDPGELWCTLVHYASPGIDTLANGSLWECRMRAYWPESNRCNGLVKITNMDCNYDILHPISDEAVSAELLPSSSLQEVTLLVPMRQDWWNRLMVWGRQKEGSGTCTLEIYDFVIAETKKHSLPPSAGIRYR